MDDILYDRQTMEALENFGQVWSRVSGPSLPKHSTDSLPELLSILHTLHRHYAALLDSFSGEHRTALRKMMQETARDFRRLQAEYYIREGNLFSAAKKALPKGKRPLLRSAILLENSLAECAGQMRPDLSVSAGARKDKATKLLISCI